MTNLKKSKNAKTELSFWSIVALFFISLGIFALTLSFQLATDDWIYHGSLCICGLTFLLIYFLKYRKIFLENILSDLRIMFTSSFALYFLIGALFIPFGNEISKERLFLIFNFSANEALKADALNFIGFGLAIFSSFLPLSMLNNLTSKIVLNCRKINFNSAIFIILLIAIPCKIYVFLHDTNYSSEAISFIWRNLAKMSYIAIFLFVLRQNNNISFPNFFILGLTIALSFMGIVTYSKADILLPIFSYLGAIALKRRSIMMPIFIAVFCLFIISTIGGALLQSRSVDRLDNQSNNVKAQNFLEFYSNSDDVSDEYKYSAWNRLSYISAQSAAISLYDSGYGSNEYKMIPWLFVPRFLYWNKPITSSAGAELYTKMTGFVGSSTGEGVFANGYYNLGWIGFILGSMLCGLLIGQLSKMTSIIVASESYIMYPFVFFGLFLAFRIDGTIVVDYLGPFIFIFYALIFFYFFTLILFKK